ncbi:cysteine-rich CWC family protein [Pseudomonas solani]|uniref:Cysteine-rich CWC family protein n=1 Tax=Pseudomonas solani TaxID=2731552 RepID=A0AAU7Y7E1_9PSED
MNQPPDPSRCPLCGQANDCAEEAASGQPCWCFSTSIAPEALRRIPLDAQDKACLCPRCARLLPPEEPT